MNNSFMLPHISKIRTKGKQSSSAALYSRLFKLLLHKMITFLYTYTYIYNHLYLLK